MAVTMRISPLPASATMAAREYYGIWAGKVDRALSETDDCLTLHFDPAEADHKAWRRAVVADLAREHAPVRINAIAGSDGPGAARAIAWLERAPGITGQLFSVDSHGAQIPA